MTAQPNRFAASPARGPAMHELPPLRVLDQLITLHLTIWCDDDGAWRGRLHFLDPDATGRDTAEIFCAATEAELWQSVRGLHDHHLRALYLSLA